MGTTMFYDGVCGLCDRLLRFVLKRDRAGVIRFAPLQSQYAVETLARFGHDPKQLDTVIVLISGPEGERTLTQARAILHVLKQLGGGWRFLATVAGVFPTVVLNFGYRLVANARYRLFGKFESCQLPSPEERTRFVAQSLPEG